MTNKGAAIQRQHPCSITQGLVQSLLEVDQKRNDNSEGPHDRAAFPLENEIVAQLRPLIVDIVNVKLSHPVVIRNTKAQVSCDIAVQPNLVDLDIITPG